MTDTAYADTKKYIIERDGYSCLICGESQNLDPHHLIARSQSPSLVDEPKNLATLCRACHDKVEARKPGYAQWKLEAVTDLMAFWRRYTKGKVWTKTGKPQEQDVMDPDLKLEKRAQMSSPEGMPLDEQDAALKMQEALKSVLKETAGAFLKLSSLCVLILDRGAWRVNHDTLEEFLKDPEIGMERSRFYKLVKFGRWRMANAEHGMPMLTERHWTKDLLPLTNTMTPAKILEIAQKAEHVPYHEWSDEVSALKNNVRHPDVELLLNTDQVVRQEDTQIGWVRKVWANEEHHFVLLKLGNTELAAAIRRGRLAVVIQ